MHVVARVRHVLARRPWLYWLAVLLVAAVAATVAAGAGAAVDDARRAWGETRTVVVARVDLAPGDPLAGATTTRSVPVPLIPTSAAGEVPAGAVARQRVAAGEIVVAVDVAASGSPQAMIPTGWSAVAVAEAVPTGALVGDRVAAVADGVVLVADGLVIGRAGDAVLVAVPEDDAPALAAASAAGVAALVLRP